jgi:hypothetical protein
MKTISESHFECYCRQNRIDFETIPTDPNTKTADYILKIPEKVIVEVKQIQDNADEKAIVSKLPEKINNEMFRVSKAPSRIRAAINDSSPQIKNSTKGVLPAVLIIYDASSNLMCLDNEDFLQAMFGDEEYHVLKGRSHFGKNQKVTRMKNTSISAIGWLKYFYPARLELILFHNPFAKNPLKNNSSIVLTNINYELSQIGNLYNNWIRMQAENPK